jgi:hypothetical protein
LSYPTHPTNVPLRPARPTSPCARLADLNGIHRRVVVFLGERPLRTEDGIEAMPLRSFLEELEGKTI